MCDEKDGSENSQGIIVNGEKKTTPIMGKELLRRYHTEKVVWRSRRTVLLYREETQGCSR